MSCPFPDCGRAATHRRYCRRHYDWLWRRGLHALDLRICPCGRLLVRRGAVPPPGTHRYQGRGLCSSCYTAARRDGTLIDRPRLIRDRDEVLAEWVELHELGARPSRRAFAAQVGMSYEAFDRMFTRARAAGDPRTLVAA